VVVLKKAPQEDRFSALRALEVRRQAEQAGEQVALLVRRRGSRIDVLDKGDRYIVFHTFGIVVAYHSFRCAEYIALRTGILCRDIYDKLFFVCG
jgi:hypothetical protein